MVEVNGVQCHSHNKVSLTRDESQNLKNKETRVDILGKLSAELIPIIMRTLTTTERLICLGVSKTWHSKLIVYPELWSTVDLYLDFNTLGPGVLRNLKLAQHHIRHLSIREPSEELWHYVVAQLTAGSLTQLQRFSLKSTGTQPKDLGSALSKVSETLATIDIYLVGISFVTIPIDELLVACPNLKTLNIQNDPFFSISAASLQIDHTERTFTYSLTDLRLSLSRMRRETLQTVLSRCPKLRHLVIHGYRYDDSIALIRPYCQNLHALILDYAMDEITSDDTGQDGIRFLAIEVNDLNHFVGLLEDYRDTLEIVKLQFGDRTHGRSFGRSSYALYNVRSLKVTDKYGVEFPSGFLQMFPAVEELYLDSFPVLYGPMITDMIGLLKLKSLRLTRIRYVDIGDLNRLFGGLAENAQLQKIHLSQCAYVEDSTLMILATMKFLQSISFCQLENVTEQGMHSFCLTLKKHMCCVDTLGLYDLPCVTDITLQHVLQLPKIKTLILSRLPYITSKAVGDLMAGNDNIDVSYYQSFD